jgi:copper chaperone CopZ
MTQLDVLYRYGVPPTEAAALAIARIREVYGVRRVAFDEAEKTVRVEYDATRLNEATIHQLLRRAGLDVIEKLPMFAAPEPPAPPAAAVPAAAK